MEWEGDKATETLYHVTGDISKITFSQRGNTMHFHSELFLTEGVLFQCRFD